jgi:hypothetical protein
MKLDTLTLKQHLAADGVFTDEQAARLAYLRRELGVVEPSGQGAPSFPPPVRRPPTPGADLAHLEGRWWEVDRCSGRCKGGSMSDEQQHSFWLRPEGERYGLARPFSSVGCLPPPA